jgi:hypothetical protein
MQSFKTPNGTELPLLDMRGKPYLQVAHRLVWFREEHPDWTIETELKTEKDSAQARAVIKDASGRIMSTAHKFEDRAGFADFREKAETGAIGRALAMVGFGTQFCADELDEGERLADSPVTPVRVAPQRPGPNDGVPSQRGYRKDFGKWTGKGLDQIFREEGEENVWNYITWLEREASKPGGRMDPRAVKFIEMAREYMAMSEGQEAAMAAVGPA